MKILLMDDSKQRRSKIKEDVAKINKDVTDINSSNDLITNIENGKADLILLDSDTWKKGKSIYNYLRISKKLEKTPIVFYNVDEETITIPDRAKNDKDVVLSRPTEVETIVDAVRQNM